MTPHLKRFQRARTSLLLDQPFFGVLALQLIIVENPAVGTMCTDGVTLQYAPAFMDTLTDDELLCVICHEVMHCACGHPWRRGARDPKKWNIACDYAVNIILTDARFSLPACGLLNDAYRGKSSEWIYDRLPDGTGAGTGAAGSGDDPGGMGEVSDAPGPVHQGDSAPVTESDWRQITQQALQQAKRRGQLPVSLDRLISAVVRPRVDWRSLLRRFVQDVARNDFTWRTPNRRYLASGLYLPSLYSEEIGPIAVAVDTSGSIDDVLLSQFASEINAIASELKPSRIDVLWCDAKVHRVDTFDRDELITFSPVGGGGTDFRPVFAHYDRDHASDRPVCLIYLTDLQGRFPDYAPEYPVIWCSTDEGTAPFGDTVRCE